MRQISEIDLSQVTRNPPRDGAEIGGWLNQLKHHQNVIHTHLENPTEK